MADFEGLIRQALARQDDSDPAIREKVYQSSRKALARMIASAGVQPPDVITRQQAALEESIRRIEADYQSRHTPRREPDEPLFPSRGRDRPTPGGRGYEEGVPAGNEANFGSPGRRPLFVPEPDSPGASRGGAFQAGSRRPELRREPELGGREDEDHYSDRPDNYRDTPRDDYRDNYRDGYREEPGSPIFRRIIAALALIAILGVIGWLGYTLFTSLMGSWMSREASTPASQTSTADPAQQDEAPDASYITVLSPNDTTALDITGRGKAEIVSQSNLEMIRLVSLRPSSAREQQAPPILVRLEEGVLSKIAGHRVTVEILAKSGTSAPATFAVGCAFADKDLCGRKRFKVGIQPEAIIFTINVGAELANANPAYLMIGTDISPTASVTGEGEPVDVLYARLRIPEE